MFITIWVHRIKVQETVISNSSKLKKLMKSNSSIKEGINKKNRQNALTKQREVASKKRKIPILLGLQFSN